MPPSRLSCGLSERSAFVVFSGWAVSSRRAMPDAAVLRQAGARRCITNYASLVAGYERATALSAELLLSLGALLYHRRIGSL